MEKILEMLLAEQHQADEPFDVTLLFDGASPITGIIESTESGVVSVTRRLNTHRDSEYADIPRHFAISAVIGAYYTEGS